MRWLVLAIFIACAAYIHGRCKVRHGFFRQLSDHSTFMSALNGFICLISRVPSSHYLQSTFFPELARSGRIGNAIRAGAIALLDANKIQAAAKYNDIGFNSFFRRGWRRCYLKRGQRPHRRIEPRVQVFVFDPARRPSD
jgi:beta-hydroxylase